MIILFSIFDIVDLINEFNIFICVDTAARLILSIFYIIWVCKRFKINIKVLKIITIIICFVGCALRIYAFNQKKYKERTSYGMFYCFLFFKTFVFFMLFLFICK